MSGEHSFLFLNIWSIMLLFGAFHGLLLASIFLKKGWKQHTSNHFFASFILTISFILSIEFLHESRLLVRTPHLLATSTPFLYLLGPLLYFYVRSLLEKKFSLEWKQGLHLLPFLICILTIIPFYSQTAEFKIEYIRQSNIGSVKLPYTRAIYYGLALLQNVFYWLLCRKLICRKQLLIKSFIKRWLTQTTVIYGFFLLIYFVVLCVFLFSDYYLREVRYIGYLLLSFTVHVFGYLLLLESEPVEHIQKAKKYSGSSLATSRVSTLKQQLLTLLETEKPYLDSGLKLENLADQLQISPQHLSQLINTGFGTNFNAFINEYRVNEAKKMLRSNKYNSYSLEGIALESGFSNRTSFYRVFKKHSGMTPSKFKNLIAEY